MIIRPDLNIEMLPKQALAAKTPANEILLGGAAGPGKSFALRFIALTAASQIPGLQVYLFRRVLDDLIMNHLEGPLGLGALVPYFKGARLIESKPPIVKFNNGSRIFLRSIPNDSSIRKVLGPEMHLVLMDELTQFTEQMYKMIRSRVRSSGLNPPAQYAHLVNRIISGTNPGGEGHAWVKHDFVDFAEPYEIVQMSDEEGGMKRQFIPSLLEDNPHIHVNDPGYAARTLGIGGKIGEAMRWGNWNILEGQYFDMFSPQRHVIEPFQIPYWWVRFRAIDWGFSIDPSVCLWLAVADGSLTEKVKPNSLIVYREYYTADKKDKALGVYASDFALKVNELSEGEKISYTVVDPSCLEHRGQVVKGPSIREEFAKCELIARGADHERIPGWYQMRQRYNDDMLYHFSSCVHTNRTIPLMQHSDKNPLDIKDQGPDHIPDALRYACMSRPWKKDQPKPEPTIKSLGQGLTYAELENLMEIHE